jgi:ureidoacrylate peracid hydrolase
MVDLPPIDAPGGVYRERAIEPKRTALLSVDMQNLELGPERFAASRRPGTREAAIVDYFERIESVVVPAQRRLQAAARAAGVEVIYTVIESLTRDGRDRSLDHKISRLHAPKGSFEAQIVDAVAPEGDEIVIPKTSSGVFNSTNIDYVLRNLGIAYLVIYGVVTDQCVESAVRDAADRGYLVTLVEDCCAAHDQGAHDRTIAAMGGHYARCRSADAVIAELQRFGAASVGE